MATITAKCHCVWLLLLWLWGLMLSDNTTIGLSMDDDLLLPYAHGHGPSHSHRHVRDCQSVSHGNVTYESWQASNLTGVPVAESHTFITDVGPRWVHGHWTVVHDPLKTVSVLEPGGPGGCRINKRTEVDQTAAAAGCLYAQNGGFFSTQSGQCHGNVVSNGKLAVNSGGVQNSQFGIRRDGTLVFGYLSEEDVVDQTNPFEQLVSGVVWLLRNGQVYINQSLEAECGDTQETGTFRQFVDVVSARTAVGHDREGNLILFHIDGQTDRRGMNLWEVADFLKRNGVVNAINLDGGGSSTYVTNGSLASYPSDHCKDPQWRCPRRVSTILCVHQRLCQPEDCSGHGTCVDGHCICQEGWHGAKCDTLVCQQPPACGAHGVCTAYGCACDAGWRGPNCSQECLPGFYGDGCNQTCTCTNGGSCDPVHGHCTCTAGYHGNSCEQLCPVGFYGLSCKQECQCPDLCPCDTVTGSCNVLIQGERNHTIYRAGHCLAKQMFTTWTREEQAQRYQSYLPDWTWLIITLSLAFLLLVSMAAHLVRECRGSLVVRHTQQRDYCYVPLNNINEDASQPKVSGEGSRCSKREFELDDTDSQDEIWSQS